MPPVYESLLLNTVVPQIQAAQAGDSYVMVVNATTPALRITQTGTGDAILVEDAANPDSSPFVVTAAGDVGIGTSSPGYKLDVSGQVRALEGGTGSGDGGLIGSTGSASGNAGVLFQTNATSRWNLTTQGTNGASLRFYNYALASTVATFDASGNLGLGVTPSAWGSGFKAFQVGTTGGLAGGNNSTYLSTNWYQDSGINNRYLTTSTAGLAGWEGNVFKWYQAASGTAGDPITFIQAMTLDASGNLGVGTTIPGSYLSGTAKLVAYANANSQNNILVRNDSNGASSSSAIALNAAGNTWGIEIGSSAKNGNALTFQLDYGVTNSEKMRLDASGNLGLGQAPAVRKFEINAISAAVSQLNGIRLQMNGVATSASEFLVGTDSGGVPFSSLRTGNDGNSYMTFFTGSGPTERARITSGGNFLIGTVSELSGNYKLQIVGATSGNGIYYQNTTNSGNAALFVNAAGSSVGDINVGASSTAYNTSSDYRLKNNIAPMTGALAKVAALKPVTYKWKADGSDGEGFIAHELQAVVPQCVTGEKDAVDAEGKPIYQGIDTSFLVATLTAAIQEQQAMINELKAEVAALKGA